MGRPPSGFRDYVEWQSRLERFASSELDIGVFCLQEGTSRSTFYRWKKRLEEGLPEVMDEPSVEVANAAELTGPMAEPSATTFLPISLKAPRVEIELPNGGVLRLPHDIGPQALISLVKVVGSLPPWKAPSA